jgi:CHASE2 domain-containing sensor protein
MPEQKWRLMDTLDRWQGNQEQVDDILVVGIRIQA